MKHEIDVSLVIEGFDTSPEEITRSLNIQPTETWLKGESIQGTAIKYKRNGWKLSSGVHKEGTFEEHVKAILEIIRPFLTQFRDVCSRYDGQLSFAIYLSQSSEQSFPNIYFDKSTLESFAKLGIEVNCDLYIVP